MPDYLRAKRRFEAFLQRIVDEHRVTPGDDFVDLLLQAKAMNGAALEGHDLLAYVHLPLVNGVAGRSGALNCRSASAMSGTMPLAWIETPLGV